MATRRKRDSVGVSSQSLEGVGVLPGGLIEKAGAAVGVEEEPPVFGVERPVEPAPNGSGVQQRKLDGRKERSRKQLPFEPVARSQSAGLLPDTRETGPQTVVHSPPLAALPADLNDSFRQIRECCLDVRKQLQTVWAALQSATEELNEVKERSQAAKQELRETETALGALRTALEGSREDLQDRIRETRVHFFSLGESCLQLRQEVLGQMQALRPKPEEALLPDASGATPAAEHCAEQPAADDEQPSRLAPEPKVPATELESEAAAPEGKTLLGVTVDPNARVVEILQDTPAEKAGLQLGDLVVSLDEKPITSSEDLRTALAQIDGNQDALLSVARGEEIQAVRISLSKSPIG